MRANLFLHPDTFIYNKVDTFNQVSIKLVSLVYDMAKVITDYSIENQFKVPVALMSVPVYEGMTIIDLAESCLEKDGLGIFYSMLANTSEEYDNININDLRMMCYYYPEEKVVNSILVFNVPEEDLSEEEKAKDEDDAKMKHQSIIHDYITFEKYEVVYSKQTWLHLRRQILGNHPENPASFVNDCREYFPNLCFHDNCVTSLTDSEYNYLETSPRKLVYYLACLNDNFNALRESHIKKGNDANTILADFSGKYGLDEPGSLQQNPAKKDLLTFCFMKNDKTKCEVVCEPHLKISQEDKNYKAKKIDYNKFHPRIYFYFGDPEIEKGRILIGSMGRHL